LATGAVLFDDAELTAWAGAPHEAGVGLLGPDFTRAFEAATKPPPDRQISSRAWPETGIYALQTGGAGADDRISVVFDCGPLGFRSIAAHGHADALSITLRAFGADVLVDPGTYDYFTYPRWREYFRSTRAHNTIVVDGVDQSEMCGGFLWGARAEATCLSWSPSADGGRVSGEHDGYRRLDDPVVHRRTVALLGEQRLLRIEDELIAKGRHDYAFCLHFGEQCRVTHAGGGRYDVEVAGGRLTLVVDPLLTTDLQHGNEEIIGGWVSRGYHRKTASTTLVGRCWATGVVRLKTRIEASRVPERRDVEEACEEISWRI